jgi:histidinol-phosphate phosphatase family protein
MKTKVPFSWPNFKMDNSWSLFLDRDGVINKRIPDEYIKNWEDFRFLPGALESLEIFSLFFKHIFIVTNQAGIEKGRLTHQELEYIHNQMMEYIQFYGGRIDEIYYCPFKPDLDPMCRKPNPGMALQAKSDFPDIDFKKCLMVGDSDSDMAFGNNLGMRTILVGHKSDNLFEYKNSIPDCKLDSLADVADFVSAFL